MQQRVLHAGVARRQLGRPVDGLEAVQRRELLDAGAVGADDHAAQRRRGAGVGERVLDHRPPGERAKVLAGEADAAGTGDEDAEGVHGGAGEGKVLSG